MSSGSAIDLLTLHRPQILLQLARDLFEDTTNLELVMTKVMQESMELIPCQHCSVLLLDMDSKEVTNWFLIKMIWCCSKSTILANGGLIFHL